MKWISVKDKLPKVSKRVLVCDNYGWIFTASYNWYDPDYKWEHSDGEEPGCQITHWMPLPKPPKGEDDAILSQQGE